MAVYVCGYNLQGQLLENAPAVLCRVSETDAMHQGQIESTAGTSHMVTEHRNQRCESHPLEVYFSRTALYYKRGSSWSVRGRMYNNGPSLQYLYNIEKLAFSTGRTVGINSSKELLQFSDQAWKSTAHFDTDACKQQTQDEGADYPGFRTHFKRNLSTEELRNVEGKTKIRKISPCRDGGLKGSNRVINMDVNPTESDGMLYMETTPTETIGAGSMKVNPTESDRAGSMNVNPSGSDEAVSMIVNPTESDSMVSKEVNQTELSGMDHRSSLGSTNMEVENCTEEVEQQEHSTEISPTVGVLFEDVKLLDDDTVVLLDNCGAIWQEVTTKSPTQGTSSTRGATERRAENSSTDGADSSAVHYSLHRLPCAVQCKVAEVAVGLLHCVARTVLGSVLTWGDGMRGQLGVEELVRITHPQTVPLLEGVNVRAVAAGGWHTMALGQCGEVYVWGWNSHGQLGLPFKTSSSSSDTPSDITASWCDCHTYNAGYKPSAVVPNKSTDPDLFKVSTPYDDAKAKDSDGNPKISKNKSIDESSDNSVSCLFNDLPKVFCGYSINNDYNLTGYDDTNTNESSTKSTLSKTQQSEILALPKTQHSQVFASTNSQESTTFALSKSQQSQISALSKNQKTGVPSNVNNCKSEPFDAVPNADANSSPVAPLASDGTRDVAINVQTTPVMLEAFGDADVNSLAAGERHSIFLLDDRSAWSCGWNKYGQTGRRCCRKCQIVGLGAVPGLGGVRGVWAGPWCSVFLTE